MILKNLIIQQLLQLIMTNTNNANSNKLLQLTTTNNANNNAFGEKKLVFKNNAPFINCISKINGTKIDNAEDLDVVMPMYNLVEYSKNYKKTIGSLWNYYDYSKQSKIINNLLPFFWRNVYFFLLICLFFCFAY